MNKEFLTTGEIAKFCEVNYRTVCKWIKEGKLKAFGTPGGHNRVKKEVFIDFCKKYNIPIPGDLETESRNKSKKILIVDDDKNMVRSIKNALMLKGWGVIETAFNGFDAGRKLSSFKPDLVILDIKMPGMNGYEVTKLIKQSPETKHTKIIVISAYFDKEGKEKALSFGAEVCLDKPFKKEELMGEINKLL